MINLLPIEDKVEIKKEYFGRLTVVAGFFLLFVCLSSIILLGPSVFLVKKYKENYAKQLDFSERRLALSSAPESISAAKELNLKLKKLKELQKSGDELSVLVKKITENKPSGVKLKVFFYDKRAKGVSDKILVQGFSSTRNNLLDFIERLRNSGKFAGVESPSSNLLSEKDIDFNIFVILKTNEE